MLFELPQRGGMHPNLRGVAVEALEREGGQVYITYCSVRVKSSPRSGVLVGTGFRGSGDQRQLEELSEMMDLTESLRLKHQSLKPLDSFNRQAEGWCVRRDL